MKHLALILSISLLLATYANAAPVVFIVRHAEKASTGGKDPDLSVEGQKRADALAQILKDSKITSVFVTEFKRTQETAAPTARAAQVSPTVVPANDIGALVREITCIERQRARRRTWQHDSGPAQGAWDRDAGQHSRGRLHRNLCRVGWRCTAVGEVALSVLITTPKSVQRNFSFS